MSTLSFICAILFSFYIFMGAYALSRNLKSRIHILFFVMTLALASWSFFAVYIYSADNQETAFQWVKFGSIGIMIFPPLILHFSIELTNAFRFRSFCYIIYLPQIIVIIRNFFKPVFFSEIYFKDGNLQFVPDFNSPWHQVYSVLVIIYTGAGIFLLYRWYFRAETAREKRQAFIIANSLFLSTSLIIIEEILLPKLISNVTLGLGPITFIFFVTGLFYSILKYRFLEISASLVSDDILENINESIVLLNTDFSINVANRKTGELVGKKHGELSGENFLDYIPENEEFKKVVDDLLNSKITSVNSKIHYSDNSSTHLMDAKISSIKDKLGDVMGILIIANETRKDEFIERYGISKREFEIILAILEGNTNKEIAGNFSISEITVKSHITHIYNKLAVDSP